MDAAVFIVAATIVLVGALGVVLRSNPIHCALSLVMTLFGIAVLFIAQDAQFLAAVQVIVYAGAIVVLFIFVIMLLGSSAQSDRDHRGQIPRTLGAVVFGAIAALSVWLLHGATKARYFDTAANDFGSIEGMGRLLFTKGLAPFELSSALLMVAIVGAVAVARGRSSADTHLPPRSTEGASEGKG